MDRPADLRPADGNTSHRDGDQDVTGLRIREAVRGLVIDEHDRVLLVQFRFPNATMWALPGGGLELNESAHDGLRRELREELGLTNAVIGAHLWNRLHIVPFVDNSYDGQREQIWEVRVAAGFEPRPTFSWEQLHTEFVFAIEWWTLEQIASSSETFGPRRLAEPRRLSA